MVVLSVKTNQVEHWCWECFTHATGISETFFACFCPSERGLKNIETINMEHSPKNTASPTKWERGMITSILFSTTCMKLSIFSWLVKKLQTWASIYIHCFCRFYLQLLSTYQRNDDLPNMIMERNQLPSQVTPHLFFGVYQWFVGWSWPNISENKILVAGYSPATNIFCLLEAMPSHCCSVEKHCSYVGILLWQWLSIVLCCCLFFEKMN